ncbi:protein translocase SEC61 complex subunit gamma [Methanobrevibacter sp.]|jgi:protein transport protein SEC61 subunit gamma-like protein|uniref:Protein translocase subunit SecE n=1 Tax=Methanobrevibacter olleyae TaxID=294671 RepID=A0A8T3VV70_METOL|nr:protein translocase SEC61 complex subunit gamma [uncultured Methanobrevibacter sp.]MBE6511855.1 protein translocase SEC61 complex subunit gamma [Methanobrevibacter olleyae]
MNIKETTSDFIKQSKRVLKVARKPDREEYFNFSKVTAIGIAIIGVIGFVIVLLGQLLGL